MPILVSIYSNKLNIITNERNIKVIIYDDFINVNIYQQKILKTLCIKYPNNKNEITELFSKTYKYYKYKNIKKTLSGFITSVDLVINELDTIEDENVFIIEDVITI
jgi:hypothetical protein